VTTRAGHPTYRAVLSINSCKKCGKAEAVCFCGLQATLAVAIIGDGKPPPSRVAAALASAMAPAGPSGGTVTYSQPPTFITSYNQVTGERYVGIWRDQRGQVIFGPTGAHVEVGGGRGSVTGTTGPTA
jgi:hypothetical protein